MRMFLAGEWRDKERRIEVTNPYDGVAFDTVPQADAGDVDVALQTLVTGAERMRRLTAHERGRILRKAAALLGERQAELGEIISREEGKVLSEGRQEVVRAQETFEVSADAARQLSGDMVPLEAAPGVRDKVGFTLRVPCGIVVAITPFNFPLNLVAHKVGPALAGGNAVLIKPATDTPLSALKLVEVLLEAGCPPEALACLTGAGRDLGQAICADPRVRKISFTGSHDVGEAICRMAGIKRVTMELGSNSPVIILDDADLERAAEMVTVAGYANAGQVCISAQRILTSRKIQGEFLDLLKPRVEALTTGDQLQGDTRVGPMIREADAQRVDEWVREAVTGGASLVTGGTRQGAVYQPTILSDVRPEMRVSREELFGPAVAVTACDSIDEAITLANQSRYGLAAAVFTQDIDRAFRFIREVDSGNLHVNWGTQWRADLMPYGGLKDSGLGKEGPHHAIREMTEEKMVVLHLK